MKHTIRITYRLIMLLTIGSILISCKRTFDEPPANQIPSLSANTTISVLKQAHTTYGTFNVVDSNIIISGIVTADDMSGAFYKEIVIQDATGAIVLLLNKTYLYLNYPVGRQVFVKCKGLTLSDDSYNGYITLGMVNRTDSAVPVSTGIPSANIPQYLFQGTLNNLVVPQSVVVLQLGTSMQDPLLGALIQLNQFQFAAKDTSRTWADTVQKLYTTILASDCNSNIININTSPYCNFASAVLPKGNGSISGIYSVSYKTVNGTKRQLLLRNLNDVDMNNSRCSGTGSGYLFDATAAFATIVTKLTINLPGWFNIAETGGISFVGYSNTSSHFASISAYGATGSPANVTSWLISPPIIIPANSISPGLIFNAEDGYDNGALFTVWVSANYNGNNTPSQLPNLWNITTYKAPTGSTSSFSSPINSGNIDLSSYVGQTIYLGFKYVGSKSANKTTTYEFDAPHIISN